jgi:hypothetical protein
MKTMKLAFGFGGSVLALAFLGGTAQAQVGTIVRGGVRVGSGGGGSAGGVTSTWHPIIYDHQVFAPAVPVRRLLIHADGTIRLVDGSGYPTPLANDKLDAGALDSLRRQIAAAAGDANYLVRSGASVRVRSVSGSPMPGSPVTGSDAKAALRTRLDAMAAALARNIVVATR